MSDDIMRRIAHIIDHERAAAPSLAEALDAVLAVCDGLADECANRGIKSESDLYEDHGESVGEQHEAIAMWRTRESLLRRIEIALRRRAVFEVMDLEGELEAQEANHE